MSGSTQDTFGPSESLVQIFGLFLRKKGLVTYLVFYYPFEKNVKLRFRFAYLLLLKFNGLQCNPTRHIL